MNLLWNLVVVVQILAALAMIGLVLMQHGKGADMGASFGGGVSGSLFGATGSANFMSRSTAVCAAVFFACTLALAYSANDRARPAAAGSVLDRPTVPPPSGAPSSAPSTGAAQVPGGSATPSSTAPAATASAPASPAPRASGAAAIPAR